MVPQGAHGQCCGSVLASASCEPTLFLVHFWQPPVVNQYRPASRRRECMGCTQNNNVISKLELYDCMVSALSFEYVEQELYMHIYTYIL